MIVRLPSYAVSQIAAGEAITSPSSIIKELTENAIDAKATRITLKMGAQSLGCIEVEDDGEGMGRMDLGLLCERHCCGGRGMYGFRGEAMAGISLCSRVTVVSRRVGDAKGNVEGNVEGNVKGNAKDNVTGTDAKGDSTSTKDRDAKGNAKDIVTGTDAKGDSTTAQSTKDNNKDAKDGSTHIINTHSSMGYIATYDGTKLSSIKQIPHSKGTKVTVKDIFYNNKNRKSYFEKRKGVAEAVMLVGRYALYHTMVEFVVVVDNKLFMTFNSRKNIGCGDTGSNTHTHTSTPNTTLSDIHRKILTLSTLYKITPSSFSHSHTSTLTIAAPYKAYTFLVTINGRPVSHSILKKRVLQVLENRNMLVYVEVSAEVDDNVLPDKSEVVAADEEVLVEEVCMGVRECIKRMGVGVICSSKGDGIKGGGKGSDRHNDGYGDGIKGDRHSDGYDSDRHGDGIKGDRHGDSNTRTYSNTYSNSYSKGYSSTYSNTRSNNMVYASVSNTTLDSLTNTHTTLNTIANTPLQKCYNLKSIASLKNNIKAVCPSFLKECTFVGFNRDILYVQRGVMLLGCRFKELMRIYFYQRVVADFGNLKSVPVSDRNERGDEGGDMCNTCSDAHFCKIKADMLREYFSISIANNTVTSSPLIAHTSIQSQAAWSSFLSYLQSLSMSNEQQELKGICELLGGMLSESVSCCEEVFECVKRDGCCCGEVVGCFWEVVGIGELYKMFERC